MGLPILPILAGVAFLAIAGKKKTRRAAKTAPSEPDYQPGGGRPSNGDSGSTHDIHTIPAHSVRPLVWNDTIAVRADQIMGEIWENSSKNLSGAMHFMLMRDTAMQLWPNVRWPRTSSEAMKQISLPPGRLVPVWIYNLGDAGEAAERIWLNLRALAWDITGFKMPV